MRNDSHRLTKAGAPEPGASIVSRILATLHLRSADSSVNDTPPDRQCIRLREKVCEGMRIADLRMLSSRQITVRKIRCRKTARIHVATPEYCLRQGDLLLAEGRRADLDAFCEQVGGQPASVDYLDYADGESLAVQMRSLARDGRAR